VEEVVSELVIERTQCNEKLTARTFFFGSLPHEDFDFPFSFFLFVFLDFVYSFEPLYLRTCSCSRSEMTCFS
jgi:hypothetical protein